MGYEIAEFEEKTPESHKEDRRGTKRESLDEVGSTSKRPSRERRSVDRFCSSSPIKGSSPRPLSIIQGPGTKLKDIPNVVFKLSKRKVDENLQALHKILFGRKSNVYVLKRNIFQFSGFVWTEDEEKHKEKLKEKIDKYTKDKLIDFCELLDIQFPKATAKKEEFLAKLLEFLESPHVTRDLVLADKEKKSKKRRSGQKPSREAAEDAPLKKETKKRKKSAETEVKTRKAEEDESEDDAKYASSGLEEGSDRVKDEDDEENEYETPMKAVTKEKGSPVMKEGKNKSSRKVKKNSGPSTEELRSVVSDLLREVDFNTATLADILKKLGDHFDTDLMDRKAEVKNILEDVINSMTDDEDDGEENNSGDNVGESEK